MGGYHFAFLINSNEVVNSEVCTKYLQVLNSFSINTFSTELSPWQHELSRQLHQKQKVYVFIISGSRECERLLVFVDIYD